MAVAQLDQGCVVTVEPGDQSPQHPLEGRAPTRQRDQLVVAGHGGAVHALGQHRDEVERRGSGGQQRVEHVGVTLEQQVAQPGEEGVGVAHLRRAPAVPVEGAVGVLGQRRVVAFDEHDLVALSSTCQPDAEPPDAGPDHHDASHGPPGPGCRVAP